MFLKRKKDRAVPYYKYMQRVDLNIIMTVIFLCIIGCLLIGSSADYSKTTKQMCFLLLAIVCMVGIGFNFDYKILYNKKIGWICYALSIAVFGLLLTPIAVTSNGATRWISFFGLFSIQISEVSKLFSILFLANYLSWKRKKFDSLGEIFKLWVIMGISVLPMLLISSNLSNTLIVLMITFTMTWIVSKDNKFHLAIFILVLALYAVALYYVSQHMPTEMELAEQDYHVGRVVALLAAEEYSQGIGFQTMQALYAIGSCGLVGKGLGNSLQKFMIPEPYNDMILAILCEEMGLVGLFMLIFLYGYLLYQIRLVFKYARDMFGKMICLGTGMHIFYQMLVNIAVVANLIPNTGVSLPFVSYGGSSIVLLVVQIGLVLSVRRKEMNHNAKKIKKIMIAQKKQKAYAAGKSKNNR